MAETGLPRLISSVASMLPIIENIIKPCHAMLVEKTHLTDEAAETSSGIRTAREASQEDAVVWSIVVGEECVGFANVLGKACASTTSHDLTPESKACSDTSLVVDDLWMAMTVFGSDRSSKPCDVGRCLKMTGVEQSFLGPATVTVHPCSITTHNELLGSTEHAFFDDVPICISRIARLGGVS